MYISSYIKFCLSISIVVLFLFFPSISYPFMSDSEIASFQKEIAGKPVGEKIALWAEKFVSTPYDTDPLGEYVTKNVIVADERVDCMYLSFRTAELALSLTPEDAINIALDRRFMNRGRLDSKGNVLNYEDRFQYGEDMLDSGRWGKEITEELGELTEIKGSRGREKVKMLSIQTMTALLKDSKASGKFKNGDFIFFVKAVEKRKVGEIVGHIGIIKIEHRTQKSEVKSQKSERKEVYLIHAGGVKNKGGEVRKEKFFDYLSSMPFIGIRASRFD